eukprot:2496390-Prymnesium_polylepis.1
MLAMGNSGAPRTRSTHACRSRRVGCGLLLCERWRTGCLCVHPQRWCRQQRCGVAHPPDTRRTAPVLPRRRQKHEHVAVLLHVWRHEPADGEARGLREDGLGRGGARYHGAVRGARGRRQRQARVPHHGRRLR